jgi:hypothetical protein
MTMTMTQAITTKYLGATNHRGARIVARSQAGRKTYSWDCGMSAAENHADAATRYAADMEWHGSWAGGALPTGDGYAFVMTSRD